MPTTMTCYPCCLARICFRTHQLCQCTFKFKSVHNTTFLHFLRVCDAIVRIPTDDGRQNIPGKFGSFVTLVGGNRSQPRPPQLSPYCLSPMLTSEAWADPHQLHPWFRMPSQKRKDLSDDDEEAPRTAYYEPRHSLSPPPRSPKRRRCDVLESGMSQLTLGGLPFGAPAVYRAPVGMSSSYLAPALQSPNTPVSAWMSSQPRTNGPPSPYVTHTPVRPATPVTLPGSVEEPASPEAAITGEPDVADVSMKGPSWYEIEKDRTSDSFVPLTSSTTLATNAVHLFPPPRSVCPPPRTTVADVPHDNTGIVITELEDSDAEDEDDRTGTDTPASKFKISSALLDRLPKPHTLGPIAPDPSLASALVLYRPVVITEEAEAEARRRKAERARETKKEKQKEVLVVAVAEPQPMGEEQPMEEDTRPCTPMVESVEPVDEPMDIEML